MCSLTYNRRVYNNRYALLKSTRIKCRKRVKGCEKRKKDREADEKVAARKARHGEHKVSPGTRKGDRGERAHEYLKRYERERVREK